MHWHRADNNRNVLYNPILGYRREAEADDHAENWSMNNEGSGVYVRFQVPAGVHRASFYFYNKDGENGHNRFRDYGMQLKADAPDVRRADALPAIASARVRDFRGGVYKRFIVHGPARYWLQVDKNYSFNTILQAVFLDKLRDETDATSNEISVANTNNRSRSNAKRGLNLWMGGVQLQAPNPYRLSPARQNAFLKLLAQKPNAQKTPSSDKTKSNAAVTLRLARQVWQRLDDLQGVKGATERQWSYRLQLLRTVEAVAAQQNVQAAARFRLTDKRAKTAVDVSSDATSSTRTNAPHWTGDASVAQAMRMQALIENWRWQLALWTPQDRADFDRATERARKNFGALRVMKTPAPKSP